MQTSSPSWSFVSSTTSTEGTLTGLTTDLILANNNNNNLGLLILHNDKIKSVKSANIHLCLHFNIFRVWCIIMNKWQVIYQCHYNATIMLEMVPLTKSTIFIIVCEPDINLNILNDLLIKQFIRLANFI